MKLSRRLKDEEEEMRRIHEASKSVFENIASRKQHRTMALITKLESLNR